MKYTIQTVLTNPEPAMLRIFSFRFTPPVVHKVPKYAIPLIPEPGSSHHHDMVATPVKSRALNATLASPRLESAVQVTPDWCTGAP